MDWLQEMISRNGVAAIFLVSFLENIGLPFPAFPFLMLVGALSLSGTVSFPLILTGAVAGAIGADLIWFAAGKWRGRRVLVSICRMSFNPDVCVESAVDLFHRRKFVTILFAKFLPGVNTVMPPLAGLAAMPLYLFLALDLAGALIWAFAGTGLGRIFGREIAQHAEALHGGLGWILVGGLAAYLVWRIAYRYYLVWHYTAPRIGAKELHRRMSEPDPPMVLDLRRDDDYARSDRMIAGSFRLRPATFHRFAHHLPAGRELVFYCT
ncbi:MAG TPA: VTT domain-containing protein [Candidatus Deferrimicrobiaceae bacterium]